MEKTQGVTGGEKNLPIGISPCGKEEPGYNVLALCLSPRNGRKETASGKGRGPKKRFSVLGLGKIDPRKRRSPPPHRRTGSGTNSPPALRRVNDESKIEPLNEQTLRASLQKPGAMVVLSSFFRQRKEMEPFFMLQLIAEIDGWEKEIPREEALKIFESFLGCTDELRGRMSDRGFYAFAQAGFASRPNFSGDFAQAVATLKKKIETCEEALSVEAFEPVLGQLLSYLGPRYFFKQALPKFRIWQGEFAQPFATGCEWEKSKLKKVEGQEAKAFNTILEKRITPNKVHSVVLSPRHGSFGGRWLKKKLEGMEASALCRPRGWGSKQQGGNWKEQKARQLVQVVLGGLLPVQEALGKIEARRTVICEVQHGSDQTTEWAETVDRDLGQLHRLLITGHLFEKEGKELLGSMDQRVTGDILKGLPDQFELEGLMEVARKVVGNVQKRVALLISRSDAICKQAMWVGDAADKSGFFASIKKDRTRQFQHMGKVTCRGQVRVNSQLVVKSEGPKDYMAALAQAVCEHWPQPYEFDDQIEEFDESWLPQLYLDLFTGTSIAAEQIPYLQLKELCPELNDADCRLKTRRMGEIAGNHDFIVEPEKKRFAALKTLWVAVERSENDSTRFEEVLRFQLQAGLWFEEKDGHLCLKEVSLEVHEIEFGAPVDWKLYDPLLKALERLKPEDEVPRRESGEHSPRH